ncbi:farnesol dehydrogenase-like [Anthonomus grandis grandis]|uniref:farnesol dehydrogenase-like n=1 Tax=Anthonomus grandis grandis TaxID=2921223 RepID=UPI00216647FA|nr:farnesol dehydrogenase-like [Anthonomus grandis grandis]
MCSVLKKYTGKVAIVTGASSGIGKAITEYLVKNGVIVAGVARRLEKIEEHAKQLEKYSGKLHPFKLDLTKPEEIVNVFTKIAKQLGPIVILINNAGLAQGGNIIDGDFEKWKLTLDTNVLALAICSREAIKNMKENNTKGIIININSMFGHQIFDIPFLNVYQASKYAVTALTETLRLEINREKLPLKITSLSPGYVKTEFTELALGRELAQKTTDSGLRPGLNADDVAEAVIYILSTPDHVNVKELTICVQGYIG